MAAATALLGGLGTYGATTAVASPSDTALKPAPSATSSPSTGGKSTDDMIQHCLKYLPADERGAAQKRMHEMMSGHGAASGHSMMDGHSSMSMGRMMDGGSGKSMGRMMSGMMDSAEDGS